MFSYLLVVNTCIYAQRHDLYPDLLFVIIHVITTGMQKEVGEGVCEFHIFDMGDYEKRKPAELKRAYYHRWGFKKQGGSAPKPQGKVGDNDKYLGLKDTIKELGHDKLDVIDIFVSTASVFCPV